MAANTVILDDWIKRDVQGEVDASSQVVGRVQVGQGAKVINSKIRGPAVVGDGVLICDSFVGPYSSIGNGTQITNSAVEHCVILEKCRITGIDRLEDSVLGRNVEVSANHNRHKALRLLLGDDSTVEL